MNAAAVFLGGGLGAVTRYAVGLLARRLGPATAWPWGTFAVNVVGCVAAGWLAWWFAHRGPVAPALRLGVTTGFLGGLTTFSAFAHESVGLWLGGQRVLAAANVTAQVGLGLAGAAFGWWWAARGGRA